MKIEVLGSSGCSTCARLKKDVESVVVELGKENDIEVVKVEDPVKIAAYGVMSTPALVVDGEVKYKGKVPSEDEIKDAIS